MVRDFEIKLIRTALIKTGGNQRRAAFLLGVKTTTLHNKIKVYGIESTKSIV
jgi:DNA-binding NtrC family response regulator